MIRNFTFLFITLFFCCFSASLQAQVGINTESPDTSAYLDIEGSTKGFLPPRLSASDRSTLDNLGSENGPATGLVIYNTTVNALQVNKGTKAKPDWVSLGEGGNTTPTTDDAIWFYLPTTPLSMTLGTTAYNTLNLYTIYQNQLAAKLGLTYTRDQIEFVILGYDTACFNGAPMMVPDSSDNDNLNLLYYRPKSAGITDASYLNIAVKITK